MEREKLRKEALQAFGSDAVQSYVHDRERLRDARRADLAEAVERERHLRKCIVGDHGSLPVRRGPAANATTNAPPIPTRLPTAGLCSQGTAGRKERKHQRCPQGQE